LTIKGITKYRTDHGDMPADSAAILKQYEGEMLFIRAFIHFKLTQIYGGVPIVDHLLGSSEYNIKRNTVADCLHFVQTELLKAIDLLPLKDLYAASEVGRATKGAAQSLLAKAYLYEASYAENYAGDVRFEGCVTADNYSKALVQAENVINSNEYKLIGIDGETFDTYWNQHASTLYPTTTPGFRYIFTVAGQNSDESIFSTQTVNDQGVYLLSRGSYLTIYTAVRNTGAGTLGWGFNCPTEDMLNDFEPGDPRIIVTIGKTGDPILISTGWNTINGMASPTNMIGRKFEASPDDYWSTRLTDGNGPNNFPYIRYADVVLFAAEAAFKTGDLSKALNYVNMVRTRARNGAATGVPANLTSITFENIIQERHLELALEGSRFFDLVRWKKTDILIGQPLQNYLRGVPQTSPVSNRFNQGVNEFFPIPLTEVINSNNNLVQYNGYQ
jgi:starch-binding outer membrane protein, SusD/RagB family